MHRLRSLLPLFLAILAGTAQAADPPAPAAAPASAPCRLVSASLFCSIAGAEESTGKCWSETPRFRITLDGSCPPAEKLQLVLNGQRLPRETAHAHAGTGNTIDFRVDRDRREFLALKPLVAREREHGAARLAVGVAQVDGAMLPTADDQPLPQIEIRLYDRAALWTAIVAVLGLATIVAGVRSGMLRDGGYDPAAFPPGQRTYSLARVQLFVWTLLIIGGFLYIWLLTGLDNGVVSSELLGAYGIATGTAAGGIWQDKGMRTTASAGFLSDILSDGSDTPSIHRLQMFAWTVVLGVIFMVEVWRDLRMPTFDNTLLSLMGISGGAYVGLKSLEQK